MTFGQFASAFAAAALLIGPMTAGADPANTRQIARAGEVLVAMPTHASVAARAGLVYSNFEKPTAPFQNGGYLVYGPANADGNGKQFVAAPFVPTQDTSMTGIAIAVNHEPAASKQLNVRIGLYADAGGVPGSLIASWPLSVVVDYTAGNFSYPVIATAPDSAVALSAGTTYWVAVDTQADSDFSGFWAYNDGGRQGKATNGTVAYWNDYTGGGWKQMTGAVPAMAVYGSAR